MPRCRNSRQRREATVYFHVHSSPQEVEIVVERQDLVVPGDKVSQLQETVDSTVSPSQKPSFGAEEQGQTTSAAPSNASIVEPQDVTLSHTQLLEGVFDGIYLHGDEDFDI